MAPPTNVDLFFAQNQTPILMGTFALQVGHHQYIKRTSPAIESAAGYVRTTNFPRTLRAGLGWAVLFAGLLTKITLAKLAIRDHSDPIVAHSMQRKPWKSPSQERA